MLIERRRLSSGQGERSRSVTLAGELAPGSRPAGGIEAEPVQAAGLEVLPGAGRMQQPAGGLLQRGLQPGLRHVR